MIEQPNLSAGQRIASLRQFFRSRRDSSGVQRGPGNDFEPTLWPQTEWSDTRLDEPLAENA